MLNPPDVQTHLVETALGAMEFIELGRGPPVLYFHGTGATAEVVAATEYPLVEDGFRLIVPHRPGYHGTPLASGQTPQACADLAAALLDRLEVARVAVIGMSGGGPAAACFAARHGPRTTALVLEGAVSHPYNDARWVSRRMKRMPRWLRDSPLGLPIVRFGVRRELRGYLQNNIQIVRQMAGERYAEIRDDPRAGQLATVFVENLVRCARQRVGMENDWYNMVGKAWLEPGSIHTPALVLHDRADPIVPFAHAEWSRQCMPAAELCDLRLGGHLIWLGADASRMHEKRTAFLRRQFAQAIV